MTYTTLLTELKVWQKTGITNVYMSRPSWNELTESLPEDVSVDSDGFLRIDNVEIGRTHSSV